jgi:opacity protein-like surface antigen
VPYVTAGLAAAGISHVGNIAGFAFGGFDVNGTAIFNPAGQDFAARMVKPGWALGAGVETRLFGNVTGKIEYLHMDFGNQTTSVANPNNTVPIAVTFNSRLKDDIVRLGLNYKFDPNLVYLPAADAPNVLKGLADARVLKRIAANLPWSWTGYYLGLNAGYSWGNTKTDAFFSDETIGGLLYTSGASSRIGGKLGGAQTGFNWQLGSWVWGIEADAQLADQRGTPSIRCPDLICNPAGTGPVNVQFDQYQKIEWFATLRGRFGVALTPHALLYMTGGGAIGEIQVSGNVYGSFDQTGAIFANQFSAITLNPGWTAGAGIEARLCENLTGRIEYLYLDLGTTHAIANNQQVMTLTTQFGSRMTDQLVRAGLNYKFGWDPEWW